MEDLDPYVALVSSLPSSERLFVAKKPPLSRLRLDARLKVLTEADAEVLRLLEDVLDWTNYDLDVTDDAATQRMRAVMARIPQPSLRDLVAQRLEMRTLLAALRLRHKGEVPPKHGWGYCRFTQQIIARWGEPAFGLERNFPWLREAGILLEKRDALGLERLVLGETHRQMKRIGAAHHFDFEAVAIYVLIWNIFDRWAKANAEAAARRFNKMAEAALQDSAAKLSEI
ncbi:hypothetical protein ACFORG_23760 [Lutimaribacter marinistellae]|uniref:Uncharacterized protein n=1 Tax=Lutimaribacter marinistellae TaxID=1820329 RepID=A0ABV7TN96_9RHOB